MMNKVNRTLKSMSKMTITILLIIMCSFLLGCSQESKARDLIKTARESTVLNDRKWCENELVSMGKTAVPPLIASLKDDAVGDGNKFSAKRTLVSIGEPAVEPLITALDDEDLKTRELAVETLGEIKDSRAVEPLVAKLTDPDIHINASIALGHIGSPAVKALVNALKDKNKDMRLNALDALNKLDKTKATLTGQTTSEPLIALLKDNEPDVRKKAVQC
jgi:HEAT repeat protein